MRLVVVDPLFRIVLLSPEGRIVAAILTSL